MISAIILNYKNVDLTEKCVKTLYEASSNASIPVEVIVVDNSAKQTAEELHKRLPKEVKIIENEKNRGFSAANNQGIKAAQGEVVLVMNNDLFMNKTVLQKGLEHITLHKKTGVWAPKLVGSFNEEQRSCGFFPTINDLILKYWFKIHSSNHLSLTSIQKKQIIEVDYVIGACMFIRKEVMKEAGRFDEDYFFSSEDVDLCWKIKKRGYDVIYDTRVEAIHLTSASQQINNWYDDPYLHKAQKIFISKRYGTFKSAVGCYIVDLRLTARKIKKKLFQG